MTSSLKNKILIANPRLKDPYFEQSVVYIYEHNEEGTLGFLLNRASNMTAAEVLTELKMPVSDESTKRKTILMGGPLSGNQLFMLYPTYHRETKKMNDSLVLLTSDKAFFDFGQGRLPVHTILSLGYSSWEPGQLLDEIKRNDWLCLDMDENLLNVPLESRWEFCKNSLGINLINFPNTIGHG